jgi:hypothetical protein
LAQIPTSTTAGGNKRGTHATDWQKSRNSSSQVASGNFSSILGGQNNRASGTSAAVGGGTSNTASQTDASVFGGSNNTASNQASIVAGGTFNTASGVLSGVFAGENHSASGEAAVAVGGAYHTVNALSAAVVGGRFGTARSIVGNYVVPASYTPIAVAAGCSQTTTLVLGRQTTDATATVLRSDTSSASTTNQVILPNNSAYFFTGEVVAGVTGAGNTKGWTVEGLIKRGANAASTVLVGTPTVTSSYADAGASAWTITATADTTNGGLAITVTGQAATTIRWVAQIRTTEMTF